VNVPQWVWWATLVGLVGLLAADLFVIGRRPHAPSTRESLTWIGVYVGLALLFAAGIAVAASPGHAGQFVAGWLTEYSLSLDNLFVFVIIMSRFGVGRHNQQRVLMLGIVLALVLRGGFIAAGAALIHQFAWIFYIFGALLLGTAWKLARQGEDDDADFRENRVVTLSRRVLPMADGYEGSQLTTRVDGRRLFTPLVIVMIAIGTTDLLFALDSIPAIFGLTTEAYLVFTANVFALMGLRQLYFLLGALLERLTYLSVGLSAILGFIGVKLVLEALHDNTVPFINGGEPIDAIPVVPVWLSLVFIVAALAVTTVWSVVASRRQAARGREARPAFRMSERVTDRARVSATEPEPGDAAE
jgi:tellurite resistance protein TerC